MKMGSDNGGGDFFFYSDNSPGREPLSLGSVLIGLIFVLTICLISWKCQSDHYRSFCTQVCSPHGDEPIIEGNNCYCRNKKGFIYDPSFGDHSKNRE